jgi:YHS domain-containing protein
LLKWKIHAHKEVNIMATEKDPVCGMQIDTSDAVGQSDFEGRTYYFCSEDCKTKFDANPAQFASDRGKAAQPNI